MEEYASLPASGGEGFGLRRGRDQHRHRDQEGAGANSYSRDTAQCTLIETAKLNGVNPQTWLTDVLGRIADHKNTRIDELLPWHYAQD